MISASSASAALVSILATMPARSPTTARSWTTSAARRTNDRATYSTPAAATASASTRSSSVGANICSRSHDRWTPGRPCVRPPLSTSASTAPSRHGDDAQRDAAVADDDAVAGVEVLEQRRVAARVITVAAARARARHEPDALVPAPGRRHPSGNAPARIFGPGRSASTPTGRPTRRATSRTVASRSRCSSTVPWLRLSRTTSTPARTIASSRAGSSLAGPSVATIFVRRVTDAYLVVRWSSCSSTTIVDRLTSPPWLTSRPPIRPPGCGPPRRLAVAVARRADVGARSRRPGSRRSTSGRRGPTSPTPGSSGGAAR